MQSWVFWFCFGVSSNLMLYKKATMWAADKTASCWTFHSVNEASETVLKEKVGPDERGIIMCCLCYTDNERGLVIISYGFECYHCLLVLTYSEPNSGALGGEPRPTFSGGPELDCLLSSNELSHHPKPTRLSALSGLSLYLFCSHNYLYLSGRCFLHDRFN